MLTDTELKARMLARALATEPKGFGSKEVESATSVALAAMQAGQVDHATFSRCISWVSNASAVRQWCVSQGFIRPERDALAIAVDAAIEAEHKRLEEMVEPKKK